MQLSIDALENFEQNPDKLFFYDLDNSYSGKECLASITDKINYLKSLNINSIAINMQNSFEWVMWYLAANNTCSSTYLISSDFENQTLEKIVKDNNIQFLVQKDSNTITKNRRLSSTSIVDVIFTSGTTSFPKGVVVEEKTFLHVAKSLIKETSQNENDLELLSMPFDRSFGLARLRTCILSGCSALVVNGLKSFPEIYSFSKDNPITGLSLVPSALQLIILQLRKKANVFNKNVRYLELGSSALIDGQFEWIKKHLSKSIVLHHYGMTECSRAFIKRLDKLDTYKKNIGKKLEGVEFKILKINKDDNHGELLLKGKNLFSCYLDENQTKKVFKDEWYCSGDICAKRDNEIFLIGRSDNQLNIGAAKVQAETIEKLIESIDFVEESLCFELPDKILGNAVCSLIKTSLSISEIKNSMKELFKKYPSYYFPSKIKIVDSIPKTFNGKKERKKDNLIKIFT